MLETDLCSSNILAALRIICEKESTDYTVLMGPSV